MDYPLYMNDNNYYIITNKAINYNVALEFDTFSNILISNEDLSQFLYIEFNEKNLKEFLNMYSYNYNYINYKFNNWLDVFNFTKNIYKNNLIY
jgi:hypothetical protein